MLEEEIILLHKETPWSAFLLHEFPGRFDKFVIQIILVGKRHQGQLLR